MWTINAATAVLNCHLRLKLLVLLLPLPASSCSWTYLKRPTCQRRAGHIYQSERVVLAASRLLARLVGVAIVVIDIFAMQVRRSRRAHMRLR